MPSPDTTLPEISKCGCAVELKLRVTVPFEGTVTVRDAGEKSTRGFIGVTV
jgi:hypothetical protein